MSGHGSSSRNGSSLMSAKGSGRFGGEDERPFDYRSDEVGQRDPSGGGAGVGAGEGNDNASESEYDDVEEVSDDERTVAEEEVEVEEEVIEIVEESYTEEETVYEESVHSSRPSQALLTSSPSSGHESSGVTTLTPTQERKQALAIERAKGGGAPLFPSMPGEEHTEGEEEEEQVPNYTTGVVLYANSIQPTDKPPSINEKHGEQHNHHRGGHQGHQEPSPAYRYASGNATASEDEAMHTDDGSNLASDDDDDDDDDEHSEYLQSPRSPQRNQSVMSEYTSASNDTATSAYSAAASNYSAVSQYSTDSRSTGGASSSSSTGDDTSDDDDETSDGEMSSSGTSDYSNDDDRTTDDEAETTDDHVDSSDDDDSSEEGDDRNELTEDSFDYDNVGRENVAGSTSLHLTNARLESMRDQDDQPTVISMQPDTFTAHASTLSSDSQVKTALLEDKDDDTSLEERLKAFEQRRRERKQNRGKPYPNHQDQQQQHHKKQHQQPQQLQQIQQMQMQQHMQQVQQSFPHKYQQKAKLQQHQMRPPPPPSPVPPSPVTPMPMQVSADEDITTDWSAFNTPRPTVSKYNQSITHDDIESQSNPSSSAPDPDEEYFRVQKRHRRFRHRSYALVFCALVVLALIAVAFYYAFVATRGSNNDTSQTQGDDGEGPPATPTDASPTDAPISILPDERPVTFDPISLDCDSINSKPNPHVVDLCVCRGVISDVPSAINARYLQHREGFAGGGGFDDVSPSSCEPRNQALWWISSGNDSQFGDAERTQRFALAVVFASLGGGNWTSSGDWLSERASCEWTGVRCEGDQVHSVDLTRVQAIGEIPREITLLDRMRRFIAPGNVIRGELPSHLFSIFGLEEVDLSDNRLSGPIPSSLFQALALTSLNLNGNFLEGGISSQISKLTGLTSLNIGNNEFVSALPNEIFDLTALQHLDIGGNSMTGIIPSSISKAAELTSLTLGPNEISGRIQSAISDLVKLETLVLKGMPITGRFLGSFGMQLTNLEELVVTETQLGGNIPTFFGGLTKLTKLDLSRNNIRNDIPSELARLFNLQTLNLNENIISGEIPTSLSSLIRLRELRLDDNLLTGEIPAEFSALSNLEVFAADGNRLSGRVSSDVCALRSDGALSTFVVDCPHRSGNEPTGVVCGVPTCCSDCRQTNMDE